MKVVNMDKLIELAKPVKVDYSSNKGKRQSISDLDYVNNIVAMCALDAIEELNDYADDIPIDEYDPDTEFEDILDRVVWDYIGAETVDKSSIAILDAINRVGEYDPFDESPLTGSIFASKRDLAYYNLMELTRNLIEWDE